MEQKTGLRIGAGGKAPRRVAEFAAQRTYGFKLMALRKPRFSHESEMKEIPAFIVAKRCCKSHFKRNRFLQPRRIENSTIYVIPH
jgi:hypothetical protein